MRLLIRQQIHLFRFWFSLRTRMNVMAKIYYRRIKDGVITIEDVLERWREAVLTLLEGDE